MRKQNQFMKFLTNDNYLNARKKTYLNEAADQIINRIKVTRKWGAVNNSKKEFQNYICAKNKLNLRYLYIII